MRLEAHLPALAPALRQLAAAAAPREACGVVTPALRIVELPNRAADPCAAFDAGPLHELEAVAGGGPLALWHTHPEDQPPSAADVAHCRASFHPWIIAGPSRIWVLYPEPRPLVGREFVYGVEDCWATVSDWHAQEAGIFLPWFERPPDGWWRESGESPYVEHAPAFGFASASLAAWGLENLRLGDVILMRIRARRTNHAAVYLGGGAILHHLYGELSRPDLYDGRYQQMTTHIARHRALSRSC